MAEKKKTEPKQNGNGEQAEKTTTTIQVKVETKGKLEMLKGMLSQPDYDGTISRLIDTIPAKLSTEETIVLEMPKSKYRWLLSHQDSCDCRTFLRDAVK